MIDCPALHDTGKLSPLHYGAGRWQPPKSGSESETSRGINRILKLRLFRWIFLHVLFASFPILVAGVVYEVVLKGRVSWRLRAEEILFFTFMISAIALGEVFELFYRDRLFNNFRLFLAAVLLAGVVVSIFLYGISFYDQIAAQPAMDGNDRMLLPSKILAGIFLAIGTLVAIMLDDMERRIWRPRY